LLLTGLGKNLDDFKTSSCGKPFSYGVLYFLLIVSVSSYGIDTFTAVNLLAFDRLTIKPAIPLRISKWIFTGCIILSWVILVFEWIRAVRVMKRGSVAESYLDPLAVRVQSIRMGKNGKGWRRFLVFTLLTRSRGLTEYVALFTYFSFKGLSFLI
jgi:Fungal potassium channel